MKTILMMISLLLTGMLTANGAQFEIGIGRTTFQAGPNGTWYQDGFPSTMVWAYTFEVIHKNVDEVLRGTES
ncbi:MAG: hypothetical protein KGI54_18810, partial [Pseudomonadota bacterium]|nr:hypothetical protein [Pseudomonadota bacterium]